jgi:hypothetical protein
VKEERAVPNNEKLAIRNGKMFGESRWLKEKDAGD